MSLYSGPKDTRYTTFPIYESTDETRNHRVFQENAEEEELDEMESSGAAKTARLHPVLALYQPFCYANSYPRGMHFCFDHIEFYRILPKLRAHYFLQANIKEEPTSMFKLMSFDYAREWFAAKQKIKEVIVASNEAVFLQRRYVIRGMLRKKHEILQPEKRFVMKKFANVQSKLKEHIQKDVGIKAKQPPVQQEVVKEEAPKRKESAEREVDRKRKPSVSECTESCATLKTSDSQIDLLEVCGIEEETKTQQACPIRSSQGKTGRKRSVSFDEKVREEQVEERPKVERVKSAKSERGDKDIAREECICTCTCDCVLFRAGQNS